MKQLLAPLACCVALASIATAQELGEYLGPGVMTDGAGQIGTRAGEQVDLRFYADANGVYDNGFLPVSLNSQGKLAQVGGLEGVEFLAGAYGSHSWKTSLLSLDYRGDFVDYPNGTFYNNTNQNLTIGYTYQKSRRLYFDLRGIGGTYTNYLGAVPGETTTPDVINQPGLLLFDSRADFLQGFAGVTYMLSARTSVTVGGDAFYVHRASNELIGVDGYDARARVQYRVSRRTSLGVEYQRSHYQFPNFYGASDINNYSAFYAGQLGRLWTLSVQGGAYQVNVAGVQTVALAPSVAALLGVATTDQSFVAHNWLPSGQISLKRRFKLATLAFSYGRTMLPGNGVYLTSRLDNGSASFNYTGVRKFSFTLGGIYGFTASIGQNIPPYTLYMGSVSTVYTLYRALHLVVRYDLRHQDITVADFRQTSYRATLGLAFSPGNVPLSLW